MREQHEKIGPLAAAERLDRCAAGVARGRHHDGGALAARRQRVIHQPREKLHGHVLERERRTVEQLEQKGRGAELRDRHHRRMPERAVGFAREPRQIGLRDRVADERPDHLDRHLGIGPAGKAGDGLTRKARPGLRHIEAAVAGQARERHIHEAKRRGFAAGGDVAHRWSLERDLSVFCDLMRMPGNSQGTHKLMILLRNQTFSSRRRLPAQIANITTNTAASPYQVMAYCRWSLRKCTFSGAGCGTPPGGTGISCSM